MFGDGDVPGVVNHEEVPSAGLEWFTVEVAVDVVLYLRSARRIEVVTSSWYLCRLVGVADGVESG